MSEIALIFPHQLFDPNPLLENAPAVALIEDSLFFGDAQYPARFHKQKLMLHRASMQQYAQQLRQQGLEVSYLEYAQHPALSKALHALKEEGHSAFRLLDPVDFMLEKRLRQFCEKQDISLEILPSPGFLNSREENQQVFSGEKALFHG
jgi:deoxyribodipyrimidine photolyase-related protein